VVVRKIEVCVSNLDKGSQYVWDQVQAHYPNIKLRRWGCLGYCQRCVHNPCVLIDDSLFLEAEDQELLWQKVKRRIEREQS
jgi:uncharacterized protein YuzB (UPF0349 family)